MNKSISNWHDIDWQDCHNKVIHLQNEIVVAFKQKDIGRIKQLQNNLCRSFAARAIAVRTVTTNVGKKNAGKIKQSFMN